MNDHLNTLGCQGCPDGSGLWASDYSAELLTETYRLAVACIRTSPKYDWIGSAKTTMLLDGFMRALET